MALNPPAVTESLRDLIRKLRLPRAWNILLFGFDNEIPEEAKPFGAHGDPLATEAAAVDRAPKRRGPKQGPVRISYEEIGTLLEEWRGRYKDFPAELTLDLLAEETGISRRQLLSYFRHSLEKDFRRWKLEQKIGDAQRILLRYPDMQVSDVAIRCGFNDSSNFFRQFKRITGSTPQDWRSDRQVL